MKCKFAATAALSFLVLGTSMWAQESGAALYQKKCAVCHGAGGEGKGKAPAVKGTSRDAESIVQQIIGGTPDSKGMHKKPVPGLNETQARAIAEFIKSLQ